MISFFSNWIEQITIAVIITSIFELVLPNGSLKKYIKVVLGIYVVFCIISPFVDSKALYDTKDVNIDRLIENVQDSSKIEVNQESMDSRLEELYIKELKEDIQKKVKECGYNIYKCDIDADLKNTSQTAGIHKIKLILQEDTSKIGKIQNVDININWSSEESKEKNNDDNIENIKQNLAEYYEISKDIISIKTK